MPRHAESGSRLILVWLLCNWPAEIVAPGLHFSAEGVSEDR
jgi:hypothetical protein